MAILTGLFRLGRDCEIRYLQDGTAVGNLALVYNYGPKPKDGGYRPSQWLEANIWGKQAESLAPYLLKGTRLDAVIESVHIEMFPKSDGTQSVKLVGRVNSVEFAGDSKPNGEQPQAQPHLGFAHGKHASSAAGVTGNGQQAAPAAPPNDTPYDDDIPF